MSYTLPTNLSQYRYKFSEYMMGSAVSWGDNNKYNTVICKHPKGGCAICDAPRIMDKPTNVYFDIKIISLQFCIGIITHKHNLEDGNIGNDDTSAAIISTIDNSTNPSTYKIIIKNNNNIVAVNNYIPKINDIITVQLKYENNDATMSFYVNGTNIKNYLGAISINNFSNSNNLIFPAVGNPSDVNNIITDSKYEANFGKNTKNFMDFLKPTNSLPYSTETEGTIFTYPIIYVDKAIKDGATQDGKTPNTAFNRLYKALASFDNGTNNLTYKFGAKINIMPYIESYELGLLTGTTQEYLMPKIGEYLNKYNWELSSNSEKFMTKLSALKETSGDFPTITNNWSHLIFTRIYLDNIHSFTVAEGSGIFAMSECEFNAAIENYAAIEIGRTANIYIENSMFYNFKKKIYSDEHKNVSILLSKNIYNNTHRKINVLSCCFSNCSGVYGGYTANIDDPTKPIFDGNIINFNNCLFGKETQCNLNANDMTLQGNLRMDTDDHIQNFNNVGPTYEVISMERLQQLIPHVYR